MRNFQILDTVNIDSDTGIFHLSASTAAAPEMQLSLRREGDYVAISASYGPVEIALRPRCADLTRTLARLKPIEGLQSTRQLGTSQAYIAFGLKQNDELVVRPTIVADATGHIAFNLSVSSDARAKLYEWLGVVAE